MSSRNRFSKRWHRVFLALAGLLGVVALSVYGRLLVPRKVTDRELAVAHRIAPVLGSEHLGVVFFDVESGDSTLLAFPNGERVLIDAGAISEGEAIVSQLRVLGVERLDTVILSHPDYDHYGGLMSVLEAFEVGRFVSNGHPSWSPIFGSLWKRLRRAGCELAVARSGDLLDLGKGSRAEVLWPDRGSESALFSMYDSNNQSLVVRIRFGAAALLLTGDLQKEGARVLTDRDPFALRSLVYKVPHHGSTTAASGPLFEAVAPTVSVIMGEGFNLEPGAFGEASREAIELLTRTNHCLVRTARTGPIFVEIRRSGVIGLGPDLAPPVSGWCRTLQLGSGAEPGKITPIRRERP